MTITWRRIPIIGRLWPYLEPDAADVRAFWDHLCQTMNTHIVTKDDDLGMQLIAGALDAMGIIDTRTFLERYATTIGSQIYLPFTPGVVVGGWSLWNQVLVGVHEHQHVLQDRKAGGLEYEWDYVTSRAARTQYEVEAMRSAMEIDWRYHRHMQSPRRNAELLRQYGCTELDVSVAEKALALAIPTIRAGGLTTVVGASAADWLDRRLRRT